MLCDPFGGKGPHLRRLLVAQPSSDGLLAEFSRVFLSSKVNARKSLHSPRFHIIITIIIMQLT